jgi:hypothetical protein
MIIRSVTDVIAELASLHQPLFQTLLRLDKIALTH